jgi:hypothetical protein
LAVQARKSFQFHDLTLVELKTVLPTAALHFTSCAVLVGPPHYQFLPESYPSSTVSTGMPSARLEPVSRTLRQDTGG